MPHIYYFCPDFPQPSGGIKALYRHVQRLIELGFAAAIVHQKRNFVLHWHGYRVPVLWLEDKPMFTPEDVLVFPEVMVDLVRQTRNFRGQRVVIALSWAPAYNRLQPGERWQDLGVNHVITPSPLIQRYLAWSMDVTVTLIPEVVEATRYFYQPTLKQPQISYTTRKDPSGEWLRGLLTRKTPALTAYTWTALRNLSEDEYAQHLRTSQLYLATTMQEGTHISVLEAMACSCLVVGYSGIGGKDYLVGDGAAQNAILVENGNLPQLSQILEQTLLALRSEPTRYATVVANAVATARAYQNPGAEATSLQAFFGQWM